jgi:hypothetical protein
MLSTGFAARPQPSATAWVCGKSFCYTTESALEWSCHPYQDDGTGRSTQSKAVDRGVAQPGRAPGSGPGGRRFESSLPDHSLVDDGWLLAHAVDLFSISIIQPIVPIFVPTGVLNTGSFVV